VKTTSEEFLQWKGANQIATYGTSDAAEDDYQSVHYPESLVLMMGSERQGLQPGLMKACDRVVSLPMAGKSDSLNLAVATGVMLYEIYSQNRKARKK
jgi:TrmH family RNA methyltransferase